MFGEARSISHLDLLGHSLITLERQFSEEELGFLLSRYDKDEWNKVRNNEFEKYDALMAFKDSVTDNFPDDMYDTTYSSLIQFTVDQYAMQGEYFPIEAMNLGQSIVVTAPRSNSWDDFTYSIMLLNVEDFNKLPMERSEARDCISERTDRYGRVDRSVLISFEYSILAEDNAEVEQVRSDYIIDEQTVFATIENVSIRGDHNSDILFSTK